MVFYLSYYDNNPVSLTFLQVFAPSSSLGIQAFCNKNGKNLNGYARQTGGIYFNHLDSLAGAGLPILKGLKHP